MGQIAHAVQASERQVYRWWAGEFHPLPIFAHALRNLKGPPPSDEGAATAAA
jgi:hypothetical protein